jgi:uncharacterized protein
LKAARPIRSSLLSLAFLAFAAIGALAEDMRVEEVVVVTKTGRHAFQAEIADTPEQRSKGMMFRTELASGRAMLFDFGKERPIAMWMKNTRVALDMIFIRADGSVVGFKKDAVPESTAVISPKFPALAVLETVAGTAERIGLEVGDKVEHAMFAR